MNALGPIGMKFIEDRAINIETAVRYGVYTGERRDGGSVVPSVAGRVIAFPYFENNIVVSEKYRAPPKVFWQRKGGKKVFWNTDVLNDAALVGSGALLVITEGEIDALTAIDCGWPFTVSVLDGAPPPRGNGAIEDPRNDHTGRYEYLWNAREQLKRVRGFIIATDDDPPGRQLASDLVSRLTAARCFFLKYPAGCKDLNDVRMRHGVEAVTHVLNTAQPYPVRGVYQLSDFPLAGRLETYDTGWWTLDQHLMLFAGEFIVITGVPGHGKSTFVLNLIANLADRHGWRAAMFSPEMPVVPTLRDIVRCIRGGHSERDDIDHWTQDNICFIGNDPATRDDDDDHTIEWVIERATDAVWRHGIRVLVIDPWNELEHARGKHETLAEYQGRAIRMLKRFGQQHGVVVIVVAHPTKDVVQRDGKLRQLSLYDIDGSAHWYNKPDHGIVIERMDDIGMVEVRVAKVRLSPETGERGKVRMRLDRTSKRFETLDQGNAMRPS